jgi:phage gp36-like protein
MPTQLATATDLSQVGVPARLTKDLTGPEIDALLLKRSAFALGYVQSSGRYTLPLISWGDDLRLAVAQLTAWDIVAVAIGKSASADDEQTWIARRDEAIAWLRDVASGKVIPLDIVDSSAASVSPDVTMQIVSDEPLGW